MNKAERRAYQDGLESDQATNARPNIPARERPKEGTAAFCGPSRFGRHDFTMRGNDGKYRCWFCAKTRAQVEQEHRS